MCCLGEGRIGGSGRQERRRKARGKWPLPCPRPFPLPSLPLFLPPSFPPSLLLPSLRRTPKPVAAASGRATVGPKSRNSRRREKMARKSPGAHATRTTRQARRRQRCSGKRDRPRPRTKRKHCDRQKSTERCVKSKMDAVSLFSLVCQEGGEEGNGR